jgi:hypothetical protein
MSTPSTTTSGPCGLPGDDEDDLASDGEALFDSVDAPINVDGGDYAGAAGGAGAPPPPPPEPPVMPSCQSVNTSGVQRSRSLAWNDFDEIVTPVFPKKTECISYVCQDHNFTHMIDS